MQEIIATASPTKPSLLKVRIGVRVRVGIWVGVRFLGGNGFLLKECPRAKTKKRHFGILSTGIMRR